MEKASVLIIDNDPILRKTLADLLEAQGCATLTAASGEEGLALLQCYAVSLALIDLGLSDIPGLDVLSTITADYPATTAIILTDNASLESAIEATNRGAFSYLVRPFEIEQLMLQIRRAIEKQRAEETLRRSESLFRGVLESAINGIIIIDDRHKILMVNRQFELMFGYERSEVVGKQVEMLVPSRFVRHWEYGQEYIAKPELRIIGRGRDIYALLKDGSELPVEIGLSPLETPDGVIVLVTIIDLTERKQAEAANRQQIHFLESMELINLAIRQEADVEHMLRNVVQTVFAIFACDRAWLLYPCDPNAPTFKVPIEICRPEYPGANILSLEVPMVGSVAQNLREMLDSDEPITYILGQERPVNDLTAEQFAVQSQMVLAIYPKTGKPWAFGMHQCSHPRIWTEKEKVLFKEIGHRVADGLSSVLFLRDLRESEARFKKLVNQAADAIYLHDMDGAFLDVNQRACDSLGFNREELLAMSAQDIDVQLAEYDHVNLWKTLHPDCPVTVEGTHKRKDGTTFPVEVRLGILQLKDRQAILCLARDITARKKNEEELKLLNEELERRVERRTLELQEAQSQFMHVEKLSVIGKLSASIAHEFNSPLQAVMTVLKGLRLGAQLDDGDRKLLEAAIGESERMKSLIRNLQDFYRPTSGKKNLVNLHAIIDSLLMLYRGDFFKRNIKIELHCLEMLPHIMVISDQIKQVFLNLLNNAAEACPDGGIITIRGWREGNMVAVAIKDTGIGIKPSNMEHIFRPFFSTKAGVKGTGLGLSVSYGIIKQHRGEIRVESKPGEGATFTVLLPINSEEDTLPSA